MAEPSKELTIAQEVAKMQAQFQAALPAHVPAEKFVRVVMTAVNSNPDLQNADRRSLLEAAMKAAQDGLIPDGRESAFVVFNTNAGTKQQPRWIKKVQYMPMVWGIAKKIRNSGELESLTANVVYEHDSFEYRLGDDEQILHSPKMLGSRGKPIGAYAIIKTKAGGIYREVMNEEEINAVRDISKAKDSGPWSGPFFTEMWRKTVLRRLAKRVPMSTDNEALMQRDDELYDLDNARNVTPVPATPIAIPQPTREKETAPSGQTDSTGGAATNRNAQSEVAHPGSQAAKDLHAPSGDGNLETGAESKSDEAKTKTGDDKGESQGEEKSVEELALAEIAGYTEQTFPDPKELNKFMKGQSEGTRLKITAAYNAKKKELWPSN